MVLENGMRMYVISYGAGTSSGVSGMVVVDINGKKGPNRQGYDVFRFYYDTNGMTYKKVNGYVDAVNNCNMYGGASAGDRLDGYSCAYWILRHNNMDYKYRNVSAEW